MMTDDASSASVEAWDRLSIVFESAQSLPIEERAAFVDSACAGQESLRVELHALLAVAERAPTYLQTLAVEVLGPAFDDAAADVAESVPPPRPEVSRPALPGTSVRHYEVLGLLGTGGMGVVHRGRDTRLGRDVALKFLSPTTFSDPAARQRLMREAQAVSSLDDPHVCAMHAIEETDDGGFCLVMSYCAGGTLRDRLRRGLLPVDDAIRIAMQLARGLATAHRQAIIHRDLKPANIGFADGDTAKILDFGVALRADDREVSSVSATPGFAGTVPYAAPELLRGADATVASDLWALGVVLYEMLVGRRPFVGSTEAALLFAILDREPDPLVRADGASIPAAVAMLVQELLAKDPTRRPRSATLVAERLQAMLAAPAAAAPLAPAHGVAVGATPQRSRVIGTLTVLAVLGIASVGAMWWKQRTSDARTVAAAPSGASTVVAPAALPTIAVLPFVVRGDAALSYLRNGMVDLLTPAFDATGLVRGVDPNTVIGAVAVSSDAVIDSVAAVTLAQRIGAQRYVVGSVVQIGTRATIRASLHDATGAELSRAVAEVADLDALFGGAESIVRQLAAAELRAPGDTVAALAAATTTSSLALRAYLDGERALRDARPAEAVAHFSRAVTQDTVFALAWYRLARAARWSEVDSINMHATERAYALVSTLPLRIQHVVRGYYALRFGHPADAERQFRQIVADYPTDVDGWMLLGETLFEHNPYVGRSSAEAGAAFQRVMELDPRNREVTVYLMDLAARAQQRGKLDTLFSMYFSPNSAGEQPGIRETYLSVHARQVRGVDRAITDPVSAYTALRRSGALPADLDAARRRATVLTAPNVNAELRREGWLALAALDAARGRVDLAERQWQAASLIDAQASLLHRATTLAAPNVESPRDSLVALRLRLTRTVGTAWNGLAAQEQLSLQRYLGGLLSMRLADTVSLASAQRELARTRGADRLAVPLSHALRGHLHRLRGELSPALDAFAQSDVSLPLALRAHVTALAQHADRLAHAQTLDALGRSADAAPWYASLRDGPSVWAAPYLTFSPQP